MGFPRTLKTTHNITANLHNYTVTQLCALIIAVAACDYGRDQTDRVSSSKA